LVSFWFYSWQANNFLLDSDILQAIKSRFLPVVSQGQMDSSTVWRLSSWSRAWELFKDNWWAGVGLGKMLTFEIADMEVTVEMRQLHNDFIALAVQLGIWGILVVIYLISSIIRAFLLYYRQINESYRLYFLTFFIWVLIFLWSANFGVYFDLNTLVIFFWLALGGMAVSQKLGSS
jgi:O-antigen ligase